MDIGSIRERIFMIKKTVMILAAASMAAQSMGLTVLAQEIQNSNVSLVEVKKTQKEVLEEQILAAKKKWTRRNWNLILNKSLLMGQVRI